MKIAILSFGTRGDVQPYLALGKALLAQGHEILLAGPNNFASWVTGHGLRSHPLGIDIEAIMQSQEVRRVISGNFFALAKVWRQTISPMVRDLLQATWEAGREADLIIYHPKAPGAADVAEAVQAVPVCATPIPMFPTAEFPAIPFTRNYGPWLNRLTYELYKLPRPIYLKIINRWRAEVLGLPRGPVFSPVGGLNRGLATRLCAVSPSVVPRPRDWDDGAYMTGYWFLDEGQQWRPDPALAAFLDAGEPPVYIGFGSMPARDPARLATVIAEGVRRAGVRAILATGWGGLEEIDLPSNLYVIQDAPHERLFQRVSAVVHHGGAGTTAAGLQAGRPTLVCPVTVDQPFWARRVWALGCGPRPQPLRRLRADRFAAALQELVRSETYRHRAQAIAQAIAREDGTAHAVEILTATCEQVQRGGTRKPISSEPP